MRYESAYVREIEERDRLRSGAGITIGLLIVLGSALISLIESPPIEGRALFWTFAVSTTVAGAAFLWCSFCVGMTFYGHIYKGSQTPVECQSYLTALRAHDAEQGRDPAATEAAFESWRDEQFGIAAHLNFKVNSRRNGWLYRANTGVMLVASFTLVAFGASTLNTRRATLAERVEITNWPGGPPMSPDPGNQSPSPAPAVPTPTAPAAPSTTPAPQPPPLHEFRGGRDVTPGVIQGNKTDK